MTVNISFYLLWETKENSTEVSMHANKEQYWHHRERKRITTEEACITAEKVQVQVRGRGVIKHSKWVIQNKDFQLL
jgi:ABC-type molybdenum transport system ATPase subunit/photorepair protein PhrA